MGGFGRLTDMFQGLGDNLLGSAGNMFQGLGDSLFGAGQQGTMQADLAKFGNGGGGGFFGDMTPFGQNGSQGFINGGFGALADIGKLYGGLQEIKLGKDQLSTQRQIANLNQQQQADEYNRRITNNYIANGAGFMQDNGYGTLAEYQDTNRMNTTRIT